MSLLSELTLLSKKLGIPSGTIKFTKEAPDTYLVFTPLFDELTLFADNKPQAELVEVRLSLFTKKNYQSLKNQITDTLLEKDITITERRFIGFEEDTGFYHYSLDVAKEYVR